MPTFTEQAREREIETLRRKGLDPSGNPLGTSNTGDDGGEGNNDDEGDGDPQPTAEQIEIANLRQQLAAANGRAAPAQQSTEEYRQLWETERRARGETEADLTARLKQLQDQIDAAKPGFDLAQILTPEEISDIDPIVLAAMTKIATSMAKNAAPKIDVEATTLQVLAKRDAQKIVDYRSRVMSDQTRGLHHLAQLAYDPQFIAWSRDSDNDVDSVITSLLSAQSTEEVDRYANIVAKRITKFRERSKEKLPTDTRTSLGSHMRREEKPKKTAADVQAIIDKAKGLARSSSPTNRAEAKKLLDSLN
jgi:hypothetical protein